MKTGPFSKPRRDLLIAGMSLTTASLTGFIPSSFAASDPRPEFAATGLGDVLDFYFGIRDASDDASIRIEAPLEVPHGELVPFRVTAPGVEKIALLTDANTEPLIMAMDQIRDRQATMIGRARMARSGHLACFALRNGRIGRSVRRVEISGTWREIAQ